MKDIKIKEGVYFLAGVRDDDVMVLLHWFDEKPDGQEADNALRALGSAVIYEQDYKQFAVLTSSVVFVPLGRTRKAEAA